MSSDVVHPGYGNKPFDGHWKPLELSGLFLFDPEIDAKLLGTSLRNLLEEGGHSSLWSGVRRINRLKLQPTRRLLNEMMSLLPSSLRSESAAALEGDQDAQSRLDAIGPWETIALGIEAATPGRPRTYVLDFLIEIERASATPNALIRGGLYAEAKAVLANDIALSAFLWPRALDILDNCRDPGLLLPWRVSVAMEVRLSTLAAMDATLLIRSPQASHPNGLMSVLLPTPEDARSTPSRRLFKWLKRAMTAETIPQLQVKLDLKDVRVDLTTLKRWSGGSQQPDRQLAHKVADALPAKEKEEFLSLYDGCRQLYLLGYIANIFYEEAKRHVGKTTVAAVAPWPAFPFGYESFDAWCARRYPFWMDFHRRRLAQREPREAA